METLIGRGGMGSVYRGRHLLIGRKIAIKFLHSHFAYDESTAARFLSTGEGKSIPRRLLSDLSRDHRTKTVDAPPEGTCRGAGYYDFSDHETETECSDGCREGRCIAPEAR